MRVVVFIRASKDSAASVGPSRELLDGMARYSDELTRSGIVLGGEALHPNAEGRHVVLSSGAVTPTETPPRVSTCWLWHVRSIEEAVEWVRRFPAPAPGEERELEIRPVLEDA